MCSSDMQRCAKNVANIYRRFLFDQICMLYFLCMCTCESRPASLSGAPLGLVFLYNASACKYLAVVPIKNVHGVKGTEMRPQCGKFCRFEEQLRVVVSD